MSGVGEAVEACGGIPESPPSMLTPLGGGWYVNGGGSKVTGPRPSAIFRRAQVSNFDSRHSLDVTGCSISGWAELSDRTVGRRA